MKYLFLLVILFRLFFFLPQHVFSHSGNTAQIDGCHFCRTNCEGYGFNYLTRHGHGSQTCNESKGPTDPLTKVSSGNEKYFYWSGDTDFHNNSI